MVVVRLALIAAGALIAADAVNQWQLGTLQTVSPVPTVEPSRPVSKAPKAPAHYPAVVRRNIFDSRPPQAPTQLTPVSDGPSEPVNLVEPLNLNVKLTGTVVGVNPKESYAFIIDQSKRKESLYRIGDRVMDEGVVAEISRDRVRLVRGAAEQILRMFEEKKPDAKRGGERRTAMNIPIVKAPQDEGTFEIDRGVVDEALEDIPRLLTQARLLPNFRAGVTDGFRIFNIVPGSLFAKIGLKNGDVLHRINDQEINDPTKFMGLFAELRDASNITLDLVRGKERKTFEYEIR